MNWLKKIAQSEVQTILMGLRSSIAAEAQIIYDYWNAEGEYGDQQFGFGGICDKITRAIEEVVSSTSFEVAEGGQDGDEHSFAVVKTPEGYYTIDIPCQLYETGGGMNWQKLPGVRFSENDVEIAYLGTEDYYWPEQEEIEWME